MIITINRGHNVRQNEKDLKSIPDGSNPFQSYCLAIIDKFFYLFPGSFAREDVSLLLIQDSDFQLNFE